MSRIPWIGAALLGLSGQNLASAQVFFDVTSVVPGGPGVGAFSGTLDGVTVTGSVAAGPPLAFAFNATGTGIGSSTTDGSSPQFSYSSVFSPAIPFTDRIGFTYSAAATNVVSVSFSSPVTDPVFHFANLDWAGFGFFATPGLSTVTLLNGNNGPDGDGIDPTFGGAAYGFLFVRDGIPATTDSTPPTSAPPTTGSRSAYASVRLNGTFSSIVFAVDALGPFSDSGSFTISVPEPGSAAFSGVSGLVLTHGAWRRRRACR